ncbi:MAG TPA: hypothetical protein VE863_15620 [Pyrinomonadaceae bacterium]|nr:hypothetical protein [Pyrinomonadaceae bacterium]
MKKQIWNIGTLLALLAAIAFFEVNCSQTTPEQGKSSPTPAKLAGSSTACTPPTTMAGSNEETAWQLFVAATCKVPNTEYLTYQTWTEQNCWYNPGSCQQLTATATAAPVRHLHGSQLGEHLRRKLGLTVPNGTPGDCSAMTQTSPNPPFNALNPFVPKNITSNAQFCEEVYVNKPEADYVNAPASGATLTNLTAQVAYAQGTPIKFPNPAIEVKADWLPAASVNDSFDCANNKPAGVYVETINGKCYALVGMHISSKLLPDWLWATFEPQSTLTNPNRCNPNLYSNCNDPWGSDPAVSTGQTTSQTTALTNLMTQAGLAKEFFNYRLTGVQIAYLDANNNAIQLGNSFVEFNASVLPHQAACMTCHSYAQVTTPGTQQAFFGPPNIGTPRPTPAGNYSEDFSWFLGFMPQSAGAKQ